MLLVKDLIKEGYRLLKEEPEIPLEVRAVLEKLLKELKKCSKT